MNLKINVRGQYLLGNGAGLKSTEACATGLFERLFMTHVWFDYLGQGVIFSRAIL